MFIRTITALLAMVVLCGSATALAVDHHAGLANDISRIAVVTSKEASGDFTAALAAVKWKADAYAGSAQDWDRLEKKLGHYDIVLASPGMKGASSPDLPKALLGFMKAGGAVVETGVDTFNGPSAAVSKSELTLKQPSLATGAFRAKMK